MFYVFENVFCRIMCFLMILPVVQCYLFCTCIGRDPQGLKLGVVNEELKTGMSSCSNYPSSGCNFSVPLSCRYLQNLMDKSYKLVSVYYWLPLSSAKTKSSQSTISTNRWSTVLWKRQNSLWKRTRCGESCISKKAIRKHSVRESKCPKIWPRGRWTSATSTYGKTCQVIRI